MQCIIFISWVHVTGPKVQRLHLGLPEDFCNIKKWWDSTPYSTQPARQEKKPYVKKCPEIKQLPSYTRTPPKSFWNTFPQHRPSKKAHTRVSATVLQHLIAQCEKHWTLTEKTVGRYTLKIGEVLSYPLSADYSDYTLLVTKRTVWVTNYNKLDRFLKLPTGIMKLLLENLQFQP